MSLDYDLNMMHFKLKLRTLKNEIKLTKKKEDMSIFQEHDYQFNKINAKYCLEENEVLIDDKKENLLTYYPDIIQDAHEFKDILKQVEAMKEKTDVFKKKGFFDFSLKEKIKHLSPIVLMAAPLFTVASSFFPSYMIVSFTPGVLWCSFLGNHFIQSKIKAKKLKKLENDLTQLQEQSVVKSETIAEKIKNKFIYKNNPLDLFHLSNILNITIEKEKFKMLNELITALDNENSKDEGRYSFSRKSFSNKFENLSMRVLKSSAKNILEDKSITKIDNNLLLAESRSLFKDSVCMYFLKNEYSRVYEFTEKTIYKHIFSIDKRWSKRELNTIAQTINSSFLEEKEKVEIINFVKKHSPQYESIVNTILNISELKTSDVDTKRGENFAQKNIEKLESKENSDKQMSVEKSLTDFLDSCTHYNKENVCYENFSSISDNIIYTMNLLKDEFRTSMDSNSAAIFKQIVEKDLPQLINEWYKMEKLKSSKEHRQSVFSCLIAVNDKLQSIVSSLQESTVKSVKVINKMYMKG